MARKVQGCVGLRSDIPLSGSRRHRKAGDVSDSSVRVMGVEGYQIAHDDLAITDCRYIAGCRRSFRSPFAPSVLLDSTDWGCGSDSSGVWNAAATATTDGTLAAGAENLIKRLIEFSRHRIL